MSDSAEPTATIFLTDTPIAYDRERGAGPGILFLPGLRSDRRGLKATYLKTWAVARGRAFLAIDHFGHGASGGRFEDGTISRWWADAVAVLDRLAAGPQILVGSSMGAWLALLVALTRPDRVAGLLTVAAAPDFTEDLVRARLNEAQRAELERDGVIRVLSDYGEPMAFSAALIDDGARNLLLRAPIAYDGPVRLLHGMADPGVPYRTSLRVAELLTGRDVRVTLVKDGDHRLSRPADMVLLGQLLDEVSSAANPSR